MKKNGSPYGLPFLKNGMVGERGFEPPTHWSQTSCATKLRYSPIMM